MARSSRAAQGLQARAGQGGHLLISPQTLNREAQRVSEGCLQCSPALGSCLQHTLIRSRELVYFVNAPGDPGSPEQAMNCVYPFVSP